MYVSSEVVAGKWWNWLSGNGLALYVYLDVGHPVQWLVVAGLGKLSDYLLSAFANLSSGLALHVEGQPDSVHYWILFSSLNGE